MRDIQYLNVRVLVYKDNMTNQNINHIVTYIQLTNYNCYILQ